MILVWGFMGCGKSTLIEQLGSQGLDLDHLIAHGVGVSSSHLGEYIQRVGLERFREIEKKALELCIKEMIDDHPEKVLALGGGALDVVSWELIKKWPKLRTVWLKLDFEQCWQRIQGDSNRPLVAQGKEALLALYERREPWYQKAQIILGPKELLGVRSYDDFVKLLGPINF